MRHYRPFLLVLAVICQVVVPQPPKANQSASSIDFRSIGNSRGNGRSISSGEGSANANTVATQEKSSGNEDDEDFLDLGYDGAPISDRDPSEIQFPNEDVPTMAPMNLKPVPPKVSVNKWQKIPLQALLQLENSGGLSNFLYNHVANAKVVRDPLTNNNILVDNNGAPLLNSRNDKVIVSPAPQTRTFVMHGTTRPVPSTRAGPVRHSQMSRTNSFDNALDVRLQQKASAPPDSCIPESKSVPVPNTIPPHILQLPKCVRVQRCGGCCLSDLMACEPAATEMVNFTVKHFAYIGNGDSKKEWEFVDEPVVQVEQHTACKCQCIIKPENCRRHHAYEDCSCVCKNKDEFNKCEGDPNKRWDKDLCFCICREIRDCSSGYYYDLNTCSCKQEVESRRLAAKPSGR